MANTFPTIASPIDVMALQVAKKHPHSPRKMEWQRLTKSISWRRHPFVWRLMALADVYDALISKRVYKPAFTHQQAKEIILEGEGSHFDPQVVQAFLAVEDLFVEIAATYKDGKSVENELERESLIASTA